MIHPHHGCSGVCGSKTEGKEMKKRIAVSKSPKTMDEIALRRWCIERAAQWPVQGPAAYGAIASAGGGYAHTVELDLLGRADRILKWIKQGASS